MNAVLTDTAAGPLSRRNLLKGGGALVVGFCIGGSALPALAARGDAAGPPDPNTIDSWIAVHADNTATVYLGKGEFGQGNTTGLLQIAARERGGGGGHGVPPAIRVDASWIAVMMRG